MFQASLLLLSLLVQSPAPAPDAPAPGGPLTYGSEAGVDIAWVDRDRLAIASDGGLRVVELGGDLGPKLVRAPRLELTSQVASTLGYLAGVTPTGEVVVWETTGWKEIGRRGGLPLEGTRVLALAPGGQSFLVGDGANGLIEAGLDGSLPKPVDYPGPGTIEDLAFDASGQLRVLPSGWRWDPRTRGWSAGEGIAHDTAGGANHLALAPAAELAATFRVEAPVALVLARETGEQSIDLGYRRPMDMARSKAAVLLSFPGEASAVERSMLVEPGDELLGSLELYDAATGLRTAELPSGDKPIGFGDALDHRTTALGLKVAALEGGALVTLDVVEHEGLPGLWLRRRGADLVATGEVQLDAGEWPIHLAYGGDLVAAIYEEQAVHAFLPDEAGGLAPGATIEVGVQDDPTGATSPPARRIFSVRPDGKLIAMVGEVGTIFFADPSTGYPHRVISVRLPREAGLPRAARFLESGELVVTCAPVEGDTSAALFEFTLDTEQATWAPGIGVDARRIGTDGHLAWLSAGVPGNIDVYGGRLVPVWLGRIGLGLDGADALAISMQRSVAVCTGGRVVVLPGNLFGYDPAGGSGGGRGKREQR
ncbi:MAG: hypothetical protein P1V81_08005 [Planctomycetota bacterium]|nr:hypothetical protein [Planctomycetota bacterium]